MNKTIKEVRDQQQRKGFIAIWDEMWQAVRKTIVLILYTIITIPVFFAISNYLCWQLMGNDICTYDNAIYDNIEKTVAENTVVVYNEETGAAEAAVIDTFAIMNMVDTCQSDRKNGEIFLRCTVKRGYFEAIVTTRINEDCKIIEMKRNYNSEKEYMDVCQPIFVSFVIGGAVVGWGVITIFSCLVIQIPVWIIKIIKEKKTSKQKADNADSEEAKSNLNGKENASKKEDDFDIVDTGDEATETSEEVPKTSE